MNLNFRFFYLMATSTYHVEHIKGFHFRASNEAGHTVDMDGGMGDAPAQAMSPMQLLAIAMGGCSGIDIIDILNKSRQPVESFSMDLEGVREKKGTYSEYTALHAHYMFTGDLDASRVRRAIRLSIDKYCSVSKLLEHTATITASFSINGERFNA